MKTTLALLGGAPAVPRHHRSVSWPIVTDDDRKAVMAVLDSGQLVSNSEQEGAVRSLESRWAERVQVDHCIGVSTGTAALALALAALGVGPGDEVIVPALSFIASGLAPIHQMAIPVFADIDPVTFNIDPTDAARLVTSRTAAIVPVHLHGLPAEMSPLVDLAKRHGLAIVEDAAQAHGATYRGRPVGSLGDAGAFSLQATKNLPTCGEGGLVTTNDPRTADRIRRTRQFGERIEPGQPRDYVSGQLGWNAKLNPIQAAFATSQLNRFDEYERRRRANIVPFLSRLARLPGLQVPVAPEHATHVWHILRFRFDQVAMGMPDVPAAVLRAVLRRILRAEGVPMSQYQLMPLPDQAVFTDRIGFGSGYPWAVVDASTPPAGSESCPVARDVVADSLTLQKRHLHPDSGSLLQRYADAFEKVWENLDVVATMARAA